MNINESIEVRVIKFIQHFIDRSKELGPQGMVDRIWNRVTNGVTLFLDSLWWGLKSRRPLSDKEFMALMAKGWQNPNELFMHLMDRPASTFLLPHASPDETRRMLEKFHPQYLSNLLNTADAICRGELTLLGHDYKFPEGIDWQTDPATGWRWPLRYRDRMSPFIGSARPVDLIIYWELNRHQHFISLGIAYWLTGKQCYVDTFLQQISSWVESNPVRHGMNWYYPLEISIRIIAWTTAFQFFRASPEFQEAVGKRFLSSLWQQADFLRHHLQNVRTRDDIPNNHLIAELTGLIVVGTAFPEFRDASEWRETGLRLLVQQANEQVYPDGVHREQASGYHRFVAELLSLVVAWSRRGGITRELVLEQTLERMLDYVMFSYAPDGTNPMWGDTDFGRTLGLGLDKDFWDFRPLLSVGAVLFKRSDWKYIAERFDEEAYWLLGSDGLDQWEELDAVEPETISRTFPQGGHYILRDRWTPDSDAAFFRSGSFGLGGEGHCAHAHCDLLSIALWVKGEPLLVDSGTYVYHGPLRDYFRLSAAHNTVLIDGTEQATPKPNFNWNQISNASCQTWSVDRVTGILSASGLEFSRTVDHSQFGAWLVEDAVVGKGEHTLEWSFNFAPELDVELNEKDHTLFVEKRGQLLATLYLPEGGLNFKLIGGLYSKQYCLKERIQKLYAVWKGSVSDHGEIFQWRFEVACAEPVLKRGEYATIAES
ncbi:MAG: alginate lyase family protein [Anaerolineae bacterium]|nr:alginate lyase family protein [Anaerolineae bacterium]